MKEDGLVDEGFAVEKGDEPPAVLHQLARELSVMGFVGIEQAQVTPPPKHHDPADGDPPDPRQPVCPRDARQILDQADRFQETPRTRASYTHR